MARVAIAGGSGYVGGELLRLLLAHPEVEVAQVSSERLAGRYVHFAHPNLRGVTDLRFCRFDALEPCDLLFVALPHAVAAGRIEALASLGERLIDCAADFRLRDPDEYERWYGEPHPAPGWLRRFTYGLPELHREGLRDTRYASGVGCNATAAILALLPLAEAGLVGRAILDLKVGSSEGGATASAASHHPERSGALRTFAPVAHRHQAEIAQALGGLPLHMTVTAVERVRGVLCTAHVFPTRPVDDRELWALYRERYGDEPFVRIVRQRGGLYRYPEPKILAGTNFCDVGFEVEPGGERLLVLSALDNLGKGAAGSAVQTMNLMLGLDERLGLEFVGLHPI